jgi:hypothetical protein
MDADGVVSCARPWLGRANFEDLKPAAAQRFVPETGEERLWRAMAPSLFAHDERRCLLGQLLRHVLVVPLAHVTFLNVHYQIYLNQIMHTSAGAWLGHIVCIPINVALLFYALAFHAGPADAPGFAPFAVNAGLLLLGLLATWYLAMAKVQRSGLWALCSLALLACLWMLGNGLGSAAASLPAGAPWYLRPLPLIGAVSLLQSCSHLFERNIPPRANFEQHWTSLRSFVWGEGEVGLGQRLRGLAWAPIGLFWGVIDEWWASAKLLPVYVLELLWSCGHQREQRALTRRRSLAALASGDPALDFVGTGGGVSVVELGEAEVRLGDARLAMA